MSRKQLFHPVDGEVFITDTYAKRPWQEVAESIIARAVLVRDTVSEITLNGMKAKEHPLVLAFRTFGVSRLVISTLDIAMMLDRRHDNIMRSAVRFSESRKGRGCFMHPSRYTSRNGRRSRMCVMEIQSGLALLEFCRGASDVLNYLRQRLREIGVLRYKSAWGKLIPTIEYEP